MPAEADCEPTFTCENSDGLCQLGNLDSVTGAFSLEQPENNWTNQETIPPGEHEIVITGTLGNSSD